MTKHSSSLPRSQMGLPQLYCLLGTGAHPWTVPKQMPGTGLVGTGQNPCQNVLVIKQPDWWRDSAWWQALSCLVVQMWLGLSGQQWLAGPVQGFGCVGGWGGAVGIARGVQHPMQSQLATQWTSSPKINRLQFYSFPTWVALCIGTSEGVCLENQQGKVWVASIVLWTTLVP